MIDIIPTVNNMINDLGIVELEFKNFESIVPLIVLTEINNSSDYVVDNKDFTSIIDIQIDVYFKSDTPIKVNEITSKISERLLAVGFIRKNSDLMRDDNYIRRVSTFSAEISNNFKVYRKG